MIGQATLTEFLNYGGIGLGGLFLFLAYSFFLKEQKRRAEARKSILYVGIAFMIIGALVSMFFGYLELLQTNNRMGQTGDTPIKVIKQEVFIPEYAIFKHRVSNGIESGPMTANAWTQKVLGSGEYSGSREWASLNNGSIDLAIGTYKVTGLATGYSLGRHKLRFKNVSTGETIVGMNAFSRPNPYWDSNLAYMSGILKVARPGSFVLEHIAQRDRELNGQGVAFEDLVSGNIDEVFTILEIIKIK